MNRKNIFRLFRSLVLFVSFATGGLGYATGTPERVELKLKSPSTVAAGATVLEFALLDIAESKELSPSDLNVTHEKKLHFLVYDPSLKEFQHVHPEFDGSVWKVDLNFTANGSYYLWAQGEVALDAEEFSSMTRLEVTDGEPAWPTPPVLTDVRSAADKGSLATLDGQRLRAGRMAMLDLTLTRQDGSKPEITPYLGAFAHVISVPTEGDSLIHVHPMDSSQPNQGILHTTFPKAGFYRLWVQFQDAGQLKIVPLSVQVF